MRFLGLMVVSAVVAFPIQAQTSTAVVGQWARPGEKTPTITIEADNKLVWIGKVPMMVNNADRNGDLVARWALTGDTLKLTEAKVRLSDGGGVQIPLPEGGNKISRLIKIEGRQLTLTGTTKDAKPEIFERLDSVKP